MWLREEVQEEEYAAGKGSPSGSVELPMQLRTTCGMVCLCYFLT